MNYSRNGEASGLHSLVIRELYFPGAWCDLIGPLYHVTSPLKMCWLVLIGATTMQCSNLIGPDYREFQRHVAKFYLPLLNVDVYVFRKMGKTRRVSE